MPLFTLKQNSVKSENHRCHFDPRPPELLCRFCFLLFTKCHNTAKCQNRVINDMMYYSNTCIYNNSWISYNNCYIIVVIIFAWFYVNTSFLNFLLISRFLIYSVFLTILYTVASEASVNKYYLYMFIRPFILDTITLNNRCGQLNQV